MLFMDSIVFVGPFWGGHDGAAMPVRVPSAWLLLGLTDAAKACMDAMAADRTALSGAVAMASSAGSTLWKQAVVSAAL